MIDPDALTTNPLQYPGVFAPDFPNNTITPTASRLYLMRFVPLRSFVATKLVFALATAAGANDNIDGGIIDSTGQRLVSSGATAGKLNATGNTPQSLTVAGTALLAGSVYYAALAFGTFGSTGALLGAYGIGTAANNKIMEAALATEDNTCPIFFKDTQTTVPSSVTFSSLACTSGCPVVAVRP